MCERHTPLYRAPSRNVKNKHIIRDELIIRSYNIIYRCVFFARSLFYTRPIKTGFGTENDWIHGRNTIGWFESKTTFVSKTHAIGKKRNFFCTITSGTRVILRARRERLKGKNCLYRVTSGVTSYFHFFRHDRTVVMRQKCALQKDKIRRCFLNRSRVVEEI